MKSGFLLIGFLFLISLSAFVSGQEVCLPNWQCTDWNECSNGIQTRTCDDLNNCNDTFSKPIESTDCLLNQCLDSDDGKDYYVKGQTSGRTWVDDDTLTSRNDYCVTLEGSASELSSCGGDNCGVYEFFCVTLNQEPDKPFVNGNIQACPNGCFDGACIESREITACVDTDGGKDVYNVGSTKGINWGTEDEFVSFTDSCSEKLEGAVTEYYCRESNGIFYVVSETIECPEGCFDSVCKGVREDSGFKSAYWKCYDGAETELIDICRSSAFWQIEAIDSCEGRCYEDGSKCGVSSFSVLDECGVDEDINKCESEGYFCSSGISCAESEGIILDDYSCPGTFICCKAETDKVEEDLREIDTICRNSCPSEGNCLPIGYRQSGEYCSGKGSFEFQLEGGETCDNSFECGSNVCVNSKCISPSLIERILEFFRRIFGNQGNN